MRSRLCACILTTAIACASVVPTFTSASAAIVGVTEAPLNGLSTDVRRIETNLGNLVADAFRWQAAQSGHAAAIGFINGGGVRANAINFAGVSPAMPAPIDGTFAASTLPFGNEVVVIENVPVATLLAALEHSVSNATDPLASSARFLQISGLRFSWDTGAAPGSRVIDAMLDDGTALIDDGVTVSGLLLDIATNSFLAEGGDLYSMLAGPYAGLAVADADAMSDFISAGLAGRVTALDYGEEGNGRILRDAQLVSSVPEPSSFLLFAAGLAAIGIGRCRLR